MTSVHLIITDNSQPLTVRRTPSVAPTAPASLSAAVLTTTADTSVFERSVLQAALFGAIYVAISNIPLNY